MLFNNPQSSRTNPFHGFYNSDAFRNGLANKDRLPLFPFLVDVELTNECNMRCLFCVQQTMERPRGYMQWPVFKKIVDECAEYHSPIRLIRIGEPFLHKDIIEYAKYVKSKGLPLHITCNGLAISEDDMKAIISLELDSLIFSFQGATKEQYAIMRNTNQYEKLKNNVIKLVELRGNKAKPFIHISSTMTDESSEQIKEFTAYWGSIVDSVGVGQTNLSILSLEQINSLKVAGQLKEAKKHETIRKEYRPCTEVYQKLSIDWDGKVSCCCSDYENFLTVGDINETSLQEIWNHSPELKIFRELLDKKKHKALTLCSKCYHTYDEF